MPIPLPPLAKAALEAVLPFHRPGPWEQEQPNAWYNRTQTTEATTANLCLTARKALSESGDERYE